MRRKWSPVSKLFLALAVASGGAAFLLVRGYAARLDALRPALGAPVSVVVAATDLSRGTTVTASMLRQESIPYAFVPPGALAGPEQAEGATLASDIAAGEPLTRTRLAAEGTGPVASLVPPGLRAFTVEAGLPRGSVLPGDRVDVLATFGGGRPHTETVASGLEVLLVLQADQAGGPIPAASADPGAGPQLVLLVSPSEAEQLAYAKAFADLTVSIEPPTPG